MHVPEQAEFAKRPGTNNRPLDELPTRPQQPKARSLSDDPEPNSGSKSRGITGANAPTQSPDQYQSPPSRSRDPSKPKRPAERLESSARHDEMISSSDRAQRGNTELQVSPSRGHEKRESSNSHEIREQFDLDSNKAESNRNFQRTPSRLKVIDVYSGAHIIILCNRLSRQQALESGC